MTDYGILIAIILSVVMAAAPFNDGALDRIGTLIGFLVIGLGVVLAINQPESDQALSLGLYEKNPWDRVSQICESRIICSRYAQTRLECAISGSIQECINIKARHFWPLETIPTFCSAGKLLTYEEQFLPSRDQCIIARASKKIKEFIQQTKNKN